jgi:hypothetical protein
MGVRLQRNNLKIQNFMIASQGKDDKKRIAEEPRPDDVSRP